MDLAQIEFAKQKIARNLKAIRARRKMSQTDLAAASGINRLQISRYEAERTLATIATLTALAHALDTTVPKLMSD